MKIPNKKNKNNEKTLALVVAQWLVSLLLIVSIP